MATPLNRLGKCLRPCQTMMLQVRCRHKFKTKNPRPKPMDRRVFEIITQPLYPTDNHYLRGSCLDPTASNKEVEEENLYEQFLIKQLREEVATAEMLIICHRLPVSPLRLRTIKLALQKHDMKFSICNNKHMKLVTEGTKLVNLEPLFTTHNMRITCKEVKIKQLMDTMKKFPDMLILGGFVGDRLVSRDNLQAFSQLPSLELLRGELVSCLNLVGGARTLSLLNSHQQTLTTHLDQYRKQLEPSE